MIPDSGNKVTTIENRIVRWLRGIGLVASLSPYLVLIGVYSDWFTGWSIIGHAPVPMLDDPNGIDLPAWTGYLAYGAMLLFIPATLLGLWGILYSSVLEIPKNFRAFLVLASPIGIWLIGFAILRADPFGALEWWFD